MRMEEGDDLSQTDIVGVVNKIVGDSGVLPVAVAPAIVDQAILMEELTRDEIRKEKMK